MTTTPDNHPIASSTGMMTYHRLAAGEDDDVDPQQQRPVTVTDSAATGVSNVIGTTAETTTMPSASAASVTGMDSSNTTSHPEPFVKSRLDSAHLSYVSQNGLAMPPMIATRGVSQQQWSDFWSTTNTVVSAIQKQRQFYHIACMIAFFVILVASPIVLYVTLDGKIPSWGMQFCKVAALISLPSLYFATANYISHVHHQKMITFFHHDQAQYFRPYGLVLECQQEIAETFSGLAGYTLYWNPIVVPTNDHVTYEDDVTPCTLDDADGWSKPQEGYYRIRHLHCNCVTWTPLNLSRFAQGSMDLPIGLADLQWSTTDDQWNDFWSQFVRLSHAYVKVYRRSKVMLILCIIFYLIDVAFDLSVAYTLFFVTLCGTILFGFQCDETEQQCRSHVAKFATQVAQPRGYYMEYRTVYHYNERCCCGCGCYLLSKSNYIYIIPMPSTSTPTFNA